MVIKDIEKPDKNFKLLVEEQKVGNIIYRISDTYAPLMNNIEKRISISIIDEEKINDYATIHGLDISGEKIRSYYLIEDKNRSTHDGEYLDDPMSYYEEVIEAFENLINSNNSEFTSKALKVFEEVKSYINKVGNKTNAI